MRWLVGAGALGRVKIREHIELVETRKDHKNKVPYHEDYTVLLVQLPTVQMGCHNEEDNGGEQRHGGVDEPWWRMWRLVEEDTEEIVEIAVWILKTNVESHQKTEIVVSGR